MKACIQAHRNPQLSPIVPFYFEEMDKHKSNYNKTQ